MQIDVLIIGQGICGTFLARELERAGLSYVVIDEERPSSASRAAAGLINPVTGRRIVKTWMIDQLLPFVQDAYREAAAALGRPFLRPAKVVDFFPTPQMRLAFLHRYEKDPQYLELPQDEYAWQASFRYELGYGLIGPCWLVDISAFLDAARKKMLEQGALRAERFEREHLVVGTGRSHHTTTAKSVIYKDIQARWVIFCDGIESFSNPLFSRLPFAPNKGEALIIEAPDLAGAAQTIFKKGLSLIPWRDGLYWVGSSYEWSFIDPGPTTAFRERTEAALNNWLRIPFRVTQHLASVRPATLERRPFVGLHPLHPAVGILNGMGTKGCSLAPYFARQLAGNLANGTTIQPDADILRFTKVLSRT